MQIHENVNHDHGLMYVIRFTEKWYKRITENQSDV